MRTEAFFVLVVLSKTTFTRRFQNIDQRIAISEGGKTLFLYQFTRESQQVHNRFTGKPQRTSTHLNTPQHTSTHLTPHVVPVLVRYVSGVRPVDIRCAFLLQLLEIHFTAQKSPDYSELSLKKFPFSTTNIYLISNLNLEKS